MYTVKFIYPSFSYNLLTCILVRVRCWFDELIASVVKLSRAQYQTLESDWSYIKRTSELTSPQPCHTSFVPSLQAWCVPHLSRSDLHSISISITTSPTVLLVFLARASRQCSMFMKATSRAENSYNVCNQHQPTQARQSQSIQSLQDTDSSSGPLSFVNPP